jgi:hypothetical protein
MLALSWSLVATAAVALAVGIAASSNTALVASGVIAVLALVPLAVAVARSRPAAGPELRTDAHGRPGPDPATPPEGADGSPPSTTDEGPDAAVSG